MIKEVYSTCNTCQHVFLKHWLELEAVGHACHAADCVLLAWTCSFIPRKYTNNFILLFFIFFFPTACSNLNFSGLLLKCQHFWSTAQYQERPGTSPSAGARISPPAGPWDRQDFFSPRSSSNVLTHTVVHVIFLRIFFSLWSSWTLIMNPRSFSVMSIIQRLSSCSPYCWPNSAMLK